MPKPYCTTGWVDDVMDKEKTPKWKDKERQMLECVAVLKKIPKLKPKTKTYHFIDLFNRQFNQAMVMLKIDACKIVEQLAKSLRIHFRNEGR